MRLTKQKKLGIILAFFALYIFIFRILKFGFFDIENLVTFFAFSTILFTIISESSVAKVIQPLILVLIGLIYVYLENTTFFGYWIFINGCLILYKYNLLSKRFYLKSTLLCFLLVITLFLASVFNAMPIVWFLGYMFFSIVSIVIVYIIFEEDIQKLLKENKEVNQNLLQIKSVSIIGERASSIVHSLKNNLSQLDAALLYIDEDIDRAKGVASIRDIIREMTRRVDNIMLVSKASYNTEIGLFDASRLLDSILSLFLCEKTFVALTTVKIDIMPEVYLKCIEIHFIMLVENIIKNSIEAIIENDKPGEIHIRLDTGSLEITNNGGPVRQCHGCHKTDWSRQCAVFDRIGNTSKANGSGNGMPQIFKTVNENNWHIKISNKEGHVSYKITFQDTP